MKVFGAACVAPVASCVAVMLLRFVVPAFNAESSVGDVLAQLEAAAAAAGHEAQIWVIDDGSSDGTRAAAASNSAVVIRLPENRGKGAALRTGLRKALESGADTVVSVDADGQHPADEAVRLALLPAPAESLVLGIRDLAAAGRPSREPILESLLERRPVDIHATTLDGYAVRPAPLSGTSNPRAWCPG